MATLEEQPQVAPITTVDPGAVYSPTNIQQIEIPSQKKASDMKLFDLENKLSKANSMAELNQISIMNQPKAMGVLTGEAAYRSKLDTARLNSFNSLYNNRLVEQQRKDAERSQFMQTYGADPSKRPKGMSKREFSAALGSGKFQEFLTPEFRQAQEANQLDMAIKRKSLAGGSGTPAGGDPVLSALDDAYSQTGGDWGKTVEILSRNYDVSSGSKIDNELRRRNGLEPIQNLTPEQQAKIDEMKPDADKTATSLATLDSAVASAETHAGASGRSGLRRMLEGWFVGSTDYTNLVAETNTIRTNILTLATDPTIKKFFGPQMSNADVQLMTSAGTMLNPELQSPEQLEKSLKQAKDLISRARAAVKQGQEQIVDQPDIYEVNGKQYRRGSDGLYYEQ